MPMRTVWLPICMIAALSAAAARGADRAEPGGPLRPNVLMIAVDDLRPLLGCYGDAIVRSPNIDRLADRGVLFTRAYCQQAVCGQSRASLLCGLRPDTLKQAGMGRHFRTVVPDVVTLPQQFKTHGYFTCAMGKVFHGAFPRSPSPAPVAFLPMDDPPSWSVPTFRAGPRYYYTPKGIEIARQVFPRQARREPGDPDDWTRYFVRGLATEAPDVPDEVPYDGQIATHAVQTLEKLKQQGQPFFMAVGFIKPHLPFVAPKRYWELYDRSSLPAAVNPQPPRAAPKLALDRKSVV